MKKICVIGTGRAGTAFFSKSCRVMGYDVGHEVAGENGIVSWCLVSKSHEVPWGPSWSELNEAEFVKGQQIREPIACISSLTTFQGVSWDFISNTSIGHLKTNGSTLYNAMRHWLSWNQEAARLAEFTWCLDDVRSGPLELFRAANWPVTESQWVDAIEKAGTKVNSSETRSLSWKESLFNPGLAIRRRRHQKQKLSWDALYKKDKALAEEIFLFWQACKKLDHG